MLLSLMFAELNNNSMMIDGFFSVACFLLPSWTPLPAQFSSRIVHLQ